MIEQRIDLTLRLGKLDDSDLVARKISTARRIVCTSNRYIKTKGIPKNPNQLADHCCLMFRSNPGSNLWSFKDKKNKQYKIRVSGNLFINDGSALAAAAKSGQGIVLLPKWLVEQELKNKELVEILSGFEPIPNATPLYAIYPKQKYLAPKVRAFIDFLADNL